MELKLILGSIIFGTSALAAPTEILANGTTIRQSQGLGAVSQQSKPLILADQKKVGKGNFASNWAGGILSPAPPSDGVIWSNVTAQFTMPKVSAPSAGDFYALAWVGMDGGIECPKAMLQVGVQMTAISRKGQTPQQQYRGFYEWYPDKLKFFDKFDIAAGHKLQMTVKATSPNSGSVTLENLSTHKAVTRKLTSKAALCGKTVEFIIDDYASVPHHDRFADFGEVAFENCYTGSPNPDMIVGSCGTEFVGVKKETNAGVVKLYTNEQELYSNLAKIKYNSK